MIPLLRPILVLALLVAVPISAQQPDSPYQSARTLMRVLARQSVAVLKQSQGNASYHVIRTTDALNKACFALEAFRFTALTHSRATSQEERERAAEFAEATVEDLKLAHDMAESLPTANLTELERRYQADSKAAIESAYRFAASKLKAMQARPSP